MMQSSQGIVVGEFDSVSNSDQRNQITRSVGTERRKALFHCTSGVTIAPINSMQDYKIDTPFDVHQLTPNANMYWIPGNIMLNAISGIAPIS